MSIHPDGDTTVKFLREEDVGLIPCASTSNPIMGDMANRLRLMDDRVMMDVFTGQPIDPSGYEARCQFLNKWQSEGVR